MSAIVIVGGGPAGFFAAITAKESAPHRRVIILEKARQVLGKVRISGGGRCNVTNACFDPAQLIQHYPRGGTELRGPFTRFGPRETVAWFAARGVKLKTEADGRMFPITDDSATIVDCLVEAARAAGVEIRTQANITRIEKSAAGFEIKLNDDESLTAERLVLATGSNAHGLAWAAQWGQTVVPPVPSLFTFQINDARLQGLAGVAAEAEARLPEAGLMQRGPLLITHWGVSGPAILKLSAWGARFLHEQQYRAALLINWLPQFTPKELQMKLTALKQEQARRAVASTSPLGLPQRLWERLVGAAGVGAEVRWAEMSKVHTTALAEQLQAGRYAITGKGQFKDEFVTCGGVALKEINFKTMESRVCPGLFVVGEALDIDGVTGGFNFQSAWTTGWLAGRGIGR